MSAVNFTAPQWQPPVIFMGALAMQRGCMIGVELGVEAWAAALIIMGIMRRLALALAVACCCPHPALADAKAGEAKAQLCILCHREAPDKRFAPTLEGQPVDYLVAAIMAFKAGRRVDPAMNANVANLSQADVRDIAEFFASRPVPARGQELEPDKVKAGERLAAEMKCGACHGAGYHGSPFAIRALQQGAANHHDSVLPLVVHSEYGRKVQGQRSEVILRIGRQEVVEAAEAGVPFTATYRPGIAGRHSRTPLRNSSYVVHCGSGAANISMGKCCCPDSALFNARRNSCSDLA